LLEAGNVYAKLGLASLSQGERQLALAHYGAALADLRERGELGDHTANGGEAPEPPGSALLAVMDDEASARLHPVGSDPQAAKTAVASSREGAWEREGWEWQRRGWDWLRATGPQAPLADSADPADDDPPEQHAPVPCTPDYAQAMTALCAGGATGAQLARLASLGVTPHHVRALSDSGLPPVSAGLLANLCAVGVTPAYIAALRAAEVDGLTPASLHTLRVAGVTPAYVRRLRDAGWTPLTAEQVWTARVTAGS
jgi:hypothetical protein